MKSYLLLLSGVFLAAYAYAAEAFHFDHLDIDDGLSHNTVMIVLQDHKGFMWFGTKDGLNRYDGKSFKIFKHRPFAQSGLKNNSIRCMVEDAENRIWVGTNSGLYRYDPVKESFSEILLPDADGKAITKPILCLECDKEGCVWIVTETNYVFCHDPETREISCRYRGSNLISTLKSDKNGRIWFYELGEGLFYTEDRFERRVPFHPIGEGGMSPNDMVSIISFNDSRMYLGFEEHGVTEVDLLSAQAIRLKLTAASGAPVFVCDILQYNAEELWIGTETGIIIYNRRTREAQHLKKSLCDPYSLSDNAVYSLCKDHEGGCVDRNLFRRHQLPAAAQCRLPEILPYRFAPESERTSRP